MEAALFSSHLGLILAISGAALAVILGGIGSIIALGRAGEAGAGVTAERSEAFGKVLLLQALAGTQGVYGFLAAIMVLNNVGLLSGSVKAISIGTGVELFAACLPVAVAGLISAVFQGRVSVAGMGIAAKNPADAGKGVIMSAMVETYAVLGLLITILLLNGIKV